MLLGRLHHGELPHPAPARHQRRPAVWLGLADDRDAVPHVGVSLVAFIIAELQTKQPFVEIRLYKNLPFAMGCLIGFLNTMEFRGTNFLLPIMLQRIYHYTPFQAGLFFLPPALVMGITSIIAGRLSDKIQPKLLLILGLLGLTYVSFQFCGLDVWATTGVLLGLILLRRGAQAFCHSPLTSSTLSGVPEDQVRMASGLFSLHRHVGGYHGRGAHGDADGLSGGCAYLDSFRTPGALPLGHRRWRPTPFGRC